ncbi:TPA: hypothetical protein ACH3X1_008831 [Trebouxia sp. C0004]
MPTGRALVDSLDVQQDRRQLVADTLQELGHLLDEQAGEALGALTKAQLQNAESRAKPVTSFTQKPEYEKKNEFHLITGGSGAGISND